jgi:hypothetical protein
MTQGMLRGRAHYATLADLALADFELRLDESNNFMARLEQHFYSGQNDLQRYERHVDRRDMRLCGGDSA